MTNFPEVKIACLKFEYNNSDFYYLAFIQKSCVNRLLVLKGSQ